ncbi:hypothetical protein AGDE_13366 [Angomonas deanei]|nr:hypothetical protein AGDE_13366 [Angomonas deanei]|eukprot:EPY22391.1 hypothetical protein AGDE_13366 [Angomonas deanei]
MTDDPDIAVREYKAALLKQNELSREKAGLQKQLDAAAIEWKKASATAVELKDEIVRLNEKVEFYKSQLDDERQKARNREERIHKSHETQSEVARRATEHNSPLPA